MFAVESTNLRLRPEGATKSAAESAQPGRKEDSRDLDDPPGQFGAMLSSALLATPPSYGQITSPHQSEASELPTKKPEPNWQQPTNSEGSESASHSKSFSVNPTSESVAVPGKNTVVLKTTHVANAADNQELSANFQAAQAEDSTPDGEGREVSDKDLSHNSLEEMAAAEISPSERSPFVSQSSCDERESPKSSATRHEELANPGSDLRTQSPSILMRSDKATALSIDQTDPGLPDRKESRTDVSDAVIHQQDLLMTTQSSASSGLSFTIPATVQRFSDSRAAFVAPAKPAEQIASEVVRQAQVVKHVGDEQRFTMRLDPPELGKLTIHLKRTAKGISLRVDAAESTTLGLVQASVQELSSNSAMHGSIFQEVSIDLTTGDHPDQSQAEPDTQPVSGDADRSDSVGVFQTTGISFVA